MLPIDLDVTRSVRSYMASCMSFADFSLERVQDGLSEAIWYSPKDRRELRKLCDERPHEFTRWLYERERDGRYTGLIMIWPPGHSTPIHDHAGLWGIELVLQGSLNVEEYELAGNAAPPRFAGTTVLNQDESCAFLGTAGYAHRCTNLSARHPAITLHIYGGLLETYRNFHVAGGEHYVAQPTIARIDGSVGMARVRGA